MLKAGETLILEPLDSEQEEKEKYKSKIIDYKDDKLYIDYPVNMKTNRTAFLLTGMQLTATFMGQDASVYLFETEVTGRTKLKKIHALVISYPGEEELVKIQRREYVRVETSLDVAVHPTGYEFAPFTTITDDVSAGGAAIILPKDSPLKPGQTIKTTFVFPMQAGEYHYAEITSEVIRFVDMRGDRKKASLQFLDITENERQVILRLCFERQLAMRKKIGR